MPTSSLLNPAPAPSDSAATRVFRVPELVSIIIDGWTQPQLARVASVNRIIAFECGRLLYKSPWIDQVVGNDPRMDGLTRAIGNWSDYFTDLRLGFYHTNYSQTYNQPSRNQLTRLFEACPSLPKLELAGLTTASTTELRPVLAPFASNIVDLTLHFAKYSTSPGGPEIWDIILACDKLKHLKLENVATPYHLHENRREPRYQLTSLIVKQRDFTSDISARSLAWLVGDSRTTLTSFQGQGIGPSAIVTLPTLVPHLEQATLYTDLNKPSQVDSAIAVASQ